MDKKITTIDPIFDFQALCDTDLGLYRLIKRDYYDRNVFNNDIFDSNDIRFIKTLLMSRIKFNPLIIFCKKGVYTEQELDDLYKQFLEEEYENILSLSIPTNIMDLASMSDGAQNVVNVKVLCESKIEEEWIHRFNSKLKCIIKDKKGFSLTNYDTIYIKNIYELLILDQESIYMKNIIIARYMFNMETASSKIEMPIVEVVKNYYKRNKFATASPYKDIVVPMNEMQ